MVLFVLTGIAALGLTAIALAAGLWVVVQRSGELRALAERGRRITGRVVERRARHSRGTAGRYRRIKLACELPDGSRHERWISATLEEWETLKQGDPVELVYLEDRPSVFGTLRLVNQARAAKGLAPLS